MHTLTDGSVANVHEGVPVWQLLVHVVNHGTQHRAEAAALLTAEGRTAAGADLFDYSEEQAHGGSSPSTRRSRMKRLGPAQAEAIDPSVTSPLCAAKAARTSSFSRAGTPK